MREKKEKKEKNVRTGAVFAKAAGTVKKLTARAKQKRKERGYVHGLPVFRVGPKKRGIAALWLLMGASLSFGVYKNFTAVNRETVYERTVVEQQIIDTNEVESFTEHFAFLYHAWGKSQQEKDARQEALAGYMTDELVKRNSGLITGECPTTSEVLKVRVNKVKELTDSIYEVRYSVKQQFTELGEEEASIEKKTLPVVMTENADVDRAEPTDGFSGTQTGETAEDRQTEAGTEEAQSETPGQESEIQQFSYSQSAATERRKVLQEDGSYRTVTERESCFRVQVYVEKGGAMAVITNPTTCGGTGRSAYTPEEKQSNGSVDMTSMSEIEEFLDTFFTLYPSVTEKELGYYVKDGVMDVIHADYVYAGLYSAAYYKEDDQIKAHVFVKYLDQTAKMTQLLEYTLTLEKGENWRIVDAQ